MNRLYAQLQLVCVAVLLLAVRAGAQPNQIVFPVDGGALVGSAGTLAFNDNGDLGFALLTGPDLITTTLFSFSTSRKSILDNIDLTPLLRSADASLLPQVFIKLDQKAGVLVAYGTDTSRGEVVFALSFDPDGKLTTLWSTHYAQRQAVSSGQELAVSEDGSRVFIIYTQLDAGGIARYKLDVMNGLTGVVLQTVDIAPNRYNLRSVMFDSVRDRLVATADTASYVFDASGPALEVASTLDSLLPIVEPLGITSEGRFLITFNGFAEGLDSGSPFFFDTYFVFDLDAGRSSRFDFRSALVPENNNITFSRKANLIVVAPKVRLSIGPTGTVNIRIGPRNRIETYKIDPTGLLTKTVEFRLSDQGQNGANSNLMGDISAPVLSSSGILGVVPTVNGRLFTFDAETGEIIGDQFVGADTVNANAVIQLLEADNLIAIANSTNTLSFMDFSTRPSISTVDVKQAKTVITGTNFLFGATVQIDGTDAGTATRAAAGPSRKITIKRGRADFPPGHVFKITVTNRDGSVSNEFQLST